MPKPRCSVPDCSRRVVARGLCPTHYQQLRRNGSVTLAKSERPRVNVPWRLPDYVVDLCRQAAALDHVDPGEWLERALLAALPMDRLAEQKLVPL